MIIKKNHLIYFVNFNQCGGCMHFLTYLFAVALWAFWFPMANFHKLIHDVIDRFWHEFLPDNSEVAVFYFMSCRNSFIFSPILQLHGLWDLISWWISKEQYIIFVFVCFKKSRPKETSSKDRNYVSLWGNIWYCPFIFQNMWKQKRKHKFSSF